MNQFRLNRLIIYKKVIKGLKKSSGPLAMKAFLCTKERIRPFPTLYFLNNSDPITLCTDASPFDAGVALHSLYLRTVRSRTLQVRLLIRTTHYYP